MAQRIADIAAAIDTHLRRFEADPSINFSGCGGTTGRFYRAKSWQSGHQVGITYNDVQGHYLSKDKATAYLRWLEAGNVGRHLDMPGEGV